MNTINIQKQKLMKRFFKELDIGTIFTNSSSDNAKLYLKFNDKEAYDLEPNSIDRIKREKFFLGYCYPLDIDLDFEYLTIPMAINRMNGDSRVSMSLPLCEYSLFNLGIDSANLREVVFFTFSDAGKKIPIDGIEDSHHIFIAIKPFVIYDLVKNQIIELTAGDAKNLSVNVLETTINATFKTE